MRVRPAELRDCAAIARITIDGWRAAYAGIVPAGYLDALDIEERRAQWEARLPALDRAAHEVFVVEDAGTVVGWCTVSAARDEDLDRGRTGELWAIYLTPARWGEGLGRVLLEAAVMWLRDAGYRDAASGSWPRTSGRCASTRRRAGSVTAPGRRSNSVCPCPRSGSSGHSPWPAPAYGPDVAVPALV